MTDKKKLKGRTKKPQGPTESWIAACCLDPSSEQVYRAAVEYVGAGFSLLPIMDDGSKAPVILLLPLSWCPVEGREKRRWTVFRERKPTADELRHWFAGDWYIDEFGIGVLAGAVSGNLEVIDLDDASVVEPWTRRVEQQAPGLLARLVRAETPRPGMHVYYRCPAVERGQSLARIPDPSRPNHARTIIETKGEGQYCIVPPSPAACHPRKRCYRFLEGKDLTTVPVITEDERQVLFDAARALSTWVDPPRPGVYSLRSVGTTQPQADRPGDDYNLRGDWIALLEKHGWTLAQVHPDGHQEWRRPGKHLAGMSATVNYGGSDLLYVFSSCASPFEEARGYTKFHAYTLLEHDGDFSAAARALADQGYGSLAIPRRRRRARALPSDSPYARYQVRSKAPGG